MRKDAQSSTQVVKQTFFPPFFSPVLCLQLQRWFRADSLLKIRSEGELIIWFVDWLSTCKGRNSWIKWLTVLLTDCFLFLLCCRLQTACMCLPGFRGSGRFCYPVNPCRNVRLCVIFTIFVKSSALFCPVARYWNLFFYFCKSCNKRNWCGSNWNCFSLSIDFYSCFIKISLKGLNGLVMKELAACKMHLQFNFVNNFTHRSHSWVSSWII